MKRFLLVAGFVLIGAGCAGSADIENKEVGGVGEAVLAIAEEFASKSKNAIPEDKLDVVETLSVYDAYLSLPAGYVSQMTSEERIDSISVHDADNYYIEYRPRTWDGLGSIAIFLVDDRELIVFERRGCGPMCEQRLYVLEVVGGEWLDRTAELWPEFAPTSAQILNMQTVYVYDNPTERIQDLPLSMLVEIPQFGTELRAYEQFTGYVYGKITWNGARFIFAPINTVVENIYD